MRQKEGYGGTCAEGRASEQAQACTSVLCIQESNSNEGNPHQRPGTLTSQACPVEKKGVVPRTLASKTRGCDFYLNKQGKNKTRSPQGTGECKEHSCDFIKATFESISDSFGPGFYRLQCSQLQRAAIALVRWWQRVTERYRDDKPPHYCMA